MTIKELIKKYMLLLDDGYESISIHIVIGDLRNISRGRPNKSKDPFINNYMNMLAKGEEINARTRNG